MGNFEDGFVEEFVPDEYVLVICPVLDDPDAVDVWWGDLLHPRWVKVRVDLAENPQPLAQVRLLHHAHRRIHMLWLGFSISLFGLFVLLFLLDDRRRKLRGR